ncbi:hypothetical protein ACLB2K_043984 [Fragaria x ananassa]
MVRCKRLRRQYYNGNENPRQLMDLPIDIVVKILLRLPVESLRRIRCVSKTLLNKVDSLSFVRQYTLSLVTGNNHVVQVPQLMCFAYTSPSDGEEDTTSVTLQSLRYDGEGGMNVEIWVMKDYAKKEWAREYNINVDMRPEFELKYATCGEWEHGIFFNDLDNSLKSNGITRFFLDLRCDSINLVTCPLETEQFSKIMSYSGSLISLRDYGTLGYTNEPNDELVTRLKALLNALII